MRNNKTYLYDNPIMHAIGKATRLTFNFILRAIGNQHFDPDFFEITQIPISLPNLDPEFHGYRIVHISDIHMGTWMNIDRLEGVVELVNAQEPDLLVITGDFVTHTIDGMIDAMVNPISRLCAKDARLAVLGNHDHWSSAQEVRRLLRLSGIRELRNEHHTVHRENSRLYIAGLDDAYNSNDRLDKVISELPEDGATILLVHIPDYADISAKTGRFGLQLSGHSHGGQIILPWIGSPVLPPFGKKYIRGLYQITGMAQYTTRGVGTSTVPIRINCPPEITVLTLHSPMKDK